MSEATIRPRKAHKGAGKKLDREKAIKEILPSQKQNKINEERLMIFRTLGLLLGSSCSKRVRRRKTRVLELKGEWEMGARKEE